MRSTLYLSRTLEKFEVKTQVMNLNAPQVAIETIHRSFPQEPRRALLMAGVTLFEIVGRNPKKHTFTCTTQDELPGFNLEGVMTMPEEITVVPGTDFIIAIYFNAIYIYPSEWEQAENFWVGGTYRPTLEELGLTEHQLDAYARQMGWLE